MKKPDKTNKNIIKSSKVKSYKIETAFNLQRN